MRIVFVILLIFSGHLLAQGKVGMDTKKTAVAVLPMNAIALNTSGDSSGLFQDKTSVEAFAESATQKIVSALVNTKRVRVIERGALDEILKEQDFQLGDFSKTDGSVKIGELAGAEYILQGQLQQISVSPATETEIINGQLTNVPAFTSTVEFNIRLISVSTGEITASKGFKGSLGFLTRKTPAEAANAALDQGVKTAGEALKLAFPAEGYILEIKKAKKDEAKFVTITCGKDLGVRKDDVFRVFTESDVELEGRTVKRSTDVGKLTVVKLEQDGIFATCEVEKGGKSISEKFASGVKLKVVQVKK